MNGRLEPGHQQHRLGSFLGNLYFVGLEFLLEKSFDLLCDLWAGGNTFSPDFLSSTSYPILLKERYRDVFAAWLDQVHIDLGPPGLTMYKA